MNPGSPDAFVKGCTCPREPNQDGRGVYGERKGTEMLFVVERSCPVHGLRVWREAEQTS